MGKRNDSALFFTCSLIEQLGRILHRKRGDIAADLGIHVSTVSRAVKGKYVQYKKTEPLKSLFTSALSRDGEREGVSSGKIKERIRALIAGEEKKPLSDQKLAEKLAEEGITVSRRAVAKYRIQMNIPDSRQRGLRL